MEKKNVFVIGLDAFHREKMAGIPEADECNFHPLLSFEETQGASVFRVERLLAKADRTLRDFAGSIDATRRVLTQIGFDNSPFNIEYFYNERHNRIDLLEINQRMVEEHVRLARPPRSGP